MSMMQRRHLSAWVVGALLIMVLFAGVREAGPEVAVSVVGRDAALKLWLYDSTGNRLTDIDDGVVFLYLSQTDSIGSTYYASYMASETTWVAAVPDTGDIYTVAYASTLHAYVLIDSLAIGGKLVPKASIYPAAFQASSVPESALTIDTVCPRHMDTDSTFILALDTTSVVPAQALPADILYESEFAAWFTATLADIYAFTKLAVDSIVPNDSTVIYIDQGAYVLPIADGALNNVLKTDGAGTVSWAADATGAGGAAYAESLETADGRFDADKYLNAGGEIDTLGIDSTLWVAFIQGHQLGGAGAMLAAAFPDSFDANDDDLLPKADVRDSVQAIAYYPGGTEVADADIVAAIMRAAAFADSFQAQPETLDVGLLIPAPDGAVDQYPFFRADSELYPSGITIILLSITLPADASYAMPFEEWAGDPPAAQGDCETVTTGASDAYMQSTSIDNGSIDADDYVFLDLPATDVDWVFVRMLYIKN